MNRRRQRAGLLAHGLTFNASPSQIVDIQWSRCEHAVNSCGGSPGVAPSSRLSPSRDTHCAYIRSWKFVGTSTASNQLSIDIRRDVSTDHPRATLLLGSATTHSLSLDAAAFYQHSSHRVEFPVRGLKWESGAKARTAPATVSGASDVDRPLNPRVWEGDERDLSREPGDLLSDVVFEQPGSAERAGVPE